MTYSPASPFQIVPRLGGDSTIFTSQIALNGNEAYAAYTPPMLEHDRTISVGASATARRVFAWMVRGNKDLLTVRVRVFGTGTGGASTLTAIVGGTSGTAAPSGAGAWYTINIVPPRSGAVACELQVTTPGGVTFDVERIQVRLIGASPAAGKLKSGVIGTVAATVGASESVASELIERLLAQPILIARDRPAVVAAHLAELTTGGAKDVGNWNSSNTTNWEPVGLLRVPRCDERGRSYYVDAYTLESVSGAVGSIAIGNVVLDLPSFGGTVGAWTSKRITLGVGAHEIRASIKPGTGNNARIATLQVWRGSRTDVP